MASATNFATRNGTFRALMGNGLLYRTPHFQRDYSWTEEEWEDLWLDILETTREGGEPAHYMGYLVLQSADDRTFDVIDGQQRLTTLSLIVLAVLKNLQHLVDGNVEPENNQRRMGTIRQSYIGYLDPVTLVTQSKLTLNRNNDRYFQNYIVPLQTLPTRGFRASEHQLRKAFDWFDEHVRDHMRNQSEDRGIALATFVETMSDRLFFTVITVTDELNAYKVFETLNARGVRLSATDLLKNYLFTVLHKDGRHKTEIEDLEDRWEAIVGRLGSESFPDFLRTHWNSRREFVRQTELFKKIRARVTTSAAVFALLRDMDEDLDTYLALTNAQSEGWPDAWREDVELLRMFSVRQPVPLLLAAKRRLDDAEFARLLRATVVISFRYNVIGGLSPAEQERTYDAAIQPLREGHDISARDLIASLTTLYPSDPAFRAAFAEKSIRTTLPRNNRVVRYILCQLERHVNGIEHDFAGSNLSVEHILPQRRDAGWDAFDETMTDSAVFRLGNMTLLEPAKNRDIANADFSTKRPVYRVSVFVLTRSLADLDDWTPQELNSRQSWMAKQATGIWRIAQLDGAAR